MYIINITRANIQKILKLYIFKYLAGGGRATFLKFILRKIFFLKNTFKKKKFTVPKFFTLFSLKLSSKIRPA